MNLPHLNIPLLLHQYGLKPKKRLGQNFLIDSKAIHQVLDSAEISSDDIVLEIGAGLGNLTRYLAAVAKRVIAVEVDSQLIPLLRSVLSQYSNVDVIQGDILNINPTELLKGRPYLVTANIPYYITSATIRHLLEAGTRPKRIVLTVQSEVAERVCAKERKNLLALSVQVFGSPKIITHVPAEAFYPTPNVDSSIVRIDIYSEPSIPPPDLGTFFLLVRAGFSQKRKTLRNALTTSLPSSSTQIERWLEMNEVDPHRRAETLSIAEWKKLVFSYHLLAV
ncbi:MAG: ribosomal RNA small subunit methyltransferase A [Anaerolineales bacterium]|nr:ribosomal RNA small subunit methyltransferase A [Anaerolineales bacterium]